MLHNITPRSAEDFAKLSEETERLAQHVEEVSLRVVAATAKRRISPSEMQGAHHEPSSHAPVAPTHGAHASSAVSSSDHPPSAPPSGLHSIFTQEDLPVVSQKKALESGVHLVVQDAGRYCLIAERRASDIAGRAIAQNQSKRKISA